MLDFQVMVDDEFFSKKIVSTVTLRVPLRSLSSPRFIFGS